MAPAREQAVAADLLLTQEFPKYGINEVQIFLKFIFINFWHTSNSDAHSSPVGGSNAAKVHLPARGCLE